MTRRLFPDLLNPQLYHRESLKCRKLIFAYSSFCLWTASWFDVLSLALRKAVSTGKYLSATKQFKPSSWAAWHQYGMWHGQSKRPQLVASCNRAGNQEDFILWHWSSWVDMAEVVVGDLHWPTDSMFIFATCPPFRGFLHPIMDYLTWQAMFTLHGQYFFVDILCCHIFCPQKLTTPRSSIVVRVFRGAAIL